MNLMRLFERAPTIDALDEALSRAVLLLADDKFRRELHEKGVPPEAIAHLGYIWSSIRDIRENSNPHMSKSSVVASILASDLVKVMQKRA